MNRDTINISSLLFKWLSQTLKIASTHCAVISLRGEKRSRTGRLVMSNYFFSSSSPINCGFIRSVSHSMAKSRPFLPLAGSSHQERPFRHSKPCTGYLIFSSKWIWWLQEFSFPFYEQTRWGLRVKYGSTWVLRQGFLHLPERTTKRFKRQLGPTLRRAQGSKGMRHSRK